MCLSATSDQGFPHTKWLDVMSYTTGKFDKSEEVSQSKQTYVGYEVPNTSDDLNRSQTQDLVYIAYRAQKPSLSYKIC